MSLLISGGKTLGPAPDMSIKVERQLHDMRILGGCGLWECAARNNPLVSQNPLLKNRGSNMLKFILFLF